VGDWKLSTDLEFIEKVRQVIGLYHTRGLVEPAAMVAAHGFRPGRHTDDFWTRSAPRGLAAIVPPTSPPGPAASAWSSRSARPTYDLDQASGVSSGRRRVGRGFVVLA
jgi:hypothetical protein